MGGARSRERGSRGRGGSEKEDDPCRRLASYIVLPQASASPRICVVQRGRRDRLCQPERGLDETEREGSTCVHCTPGRQEEKHRRE